MSFYDGEKIRARVGSTYSEKFEVKVGVHQGDGLSPLLFSTFVYVVTEKARSGVINEVLCTDDFVLRSEIMRDWKEKF